MLHQICLEHWSLIPELDSSPDHVFKWRPDLVLICNPVGFHFYVDGLGPNVAHARAFGERCKQYVHVYTPYKFTLLYIFANE